MCKISISIESTKENLKYGKRIQIIWPLELGQLFMNNLDYLIN